MVENNKRKKRRYLLNDLEFEILHRDSGHSGVIAVLEVLVMVMLVVVLVVKVMVKLVTVLFVWNQCVIFSFRNGKIGSNKGIDERRRRGGGINGGCNGGGGRRGNLFTAFHWGEKKLSPAFYSSLSVSAVFRFLRSDHFIGRYLFDILLWSPLSPCSNHSFIFFYWVN